MLFLHLTANKGGDDEMASLRDSLARQLMNLVQLRLNVDVQREQYHEEERVYLAKQRRQELSAIRQAKSRELKMLIEMGFERQCTHDERLGT